MTTEQGYRIALVTISGEQVATMLARTLVEERLAACVNLIPGVRSIYHWQGQIEEEQELLMVIKTSAELAGELTARVIELHPYDVPEVLLLPITGGSEGYLAWLLNELKTAPGG